MKAIFKWINEFTEAMFALAFGIVIIALFFAGVVFFASVIRGIVIVFTWGWFVTPLFGIRSISLSEAVGLSLFVSILFPNMFTQQSDVRGDYAGKPNIIEISSKFFGWAVIGPAFFLFFAWLWHTFCMNISVPHWFDFLGP
jgi:hypothetical protein